MDAPGARPRDAPGLSAGGRTRTGPFRVRLSVCGVVCRYGKPGLERGVESLERVGRKGADADRAPDHAPPSGQHLHQTGETRPRPGPDCHRRRPEARGAEAKARCATRRNDEEMTAWILTSQPPTSGRA